MLNMKSTLNEYRIQWLYYFFLFDNLLSIIENGILPKNIVRQIIPDYCSFANESVQKRRQTKKIKFSCGKRLLIHDAVPLYFTPFTPTLFAVREKSNEICFAVVDADVIFDPENSFAFSDGNAGSSRTRFFCDTKDLCRLPWDIIRATYWNDFEDGVRRRNSECLIYPKVAIDKIKWFIVSTDENKRHAKDFLDLSGINHIKVRNSPNLFVFLNSY